MAEKSGKVGAFYATSGTGTEQASESHSLVASATYLTHKNVIVSNLYSKKTGTAQPYKRWYSTPMGHLTVVGAAATASVNVKYRWWAETGETGTAKGTIKQYGGFFNWSIDDTMDVVEITDFQDSGHRAYLAALDGWTAGAERHWVDSGMFSMVGELDTASMVIAKFYVNDSDAAKGIGSASDTGDRYEGYCHLVGLSPSLAVDTLINESLAFQGTGQLVYES